MSIYDIVYKDACNDLYPTNKRLPVMLHKEYCFLDGVDFIQKLFGYLRDGATVPIYDTLVSYVFGSMVIFQRKVYFRNEITEGYAIGQDPTTQYWTTVLDDFIGTNEKVYFGPGKLVLEYALNAIFQTVFRQPPTNSDIYILNNITNQFQFYVGIDDMESSYVPLNDTEAIAFITDSDAMGGYNFTVMVPNAVLSIITSAAVTSVVNRYKLSGYTFNVLGY